MLGKFDSYRDSALHFLCSSDWGNESFGDVTDYGVYIWRISNSWEEVKPENTEFNSVLEDLHSELEDAFNELGVTEEEFRKTLVGHFMVSENSQGLVTVKQYTLESELIRHFNQMRDHYDEWLSAYRETED